MSIDEKKPLRKKSINSEIGNKDKTDMQFAKENFFKRLGSNLTVEPVLAGAVIPWSLARLAMQNLNLEKACLVKLKYGHEICDQLIQSKHNLTLNEVKVQKVISSIETWKSMFQIGLPIFLVMFVGAWSDKTGNRKICILLPVFGELLVCVSNAVSTFYFYEIPVELTMFLEALFPAITGGWIMMFLGSYSYISDITTDEDRTYRIGLAHLCITAGIPIGTALSALLMSSWGYLRIFQLSASLLLFPITYGLLVLKNNTKPVNHETELRNTITFSELVSLQRDTISVITKRRPGNVRLKIVLTLAIVAVMYGPDHAETFITYLFVRYRLSWNAVKYSIFSTYRLVANSLAGYLSITVFSKRWGFDDATLCLISVTSRLAGLLYTNFVHTDVEMYMMPLVEFWNATTFTSLRSMSSKLVSNEELGKIYSLISLVEALAALVFDPLYATLYAFTMNRHAGAVFLFSAAMTVPAIMILLWFQYTMRSAETGQNTYRRLSKGNYY